MRLRLLVLCATLLACSSPPTRTGSSDDDPDASTVVAADADPVPDDGAPGSIDGGSTRADKIVFVTSTVHPGSLGGVTGADELCSDRALAAGLDGEFRAWLSTTTSSAESRLAHATVPYVLTSGVRVADDWDDLTDGALAHPIDRDEDASSASGDVWTGSEPDGSISPEGTCAGFTDGTSGAVGRCGATSQANAAWTSSFTPSCSTQLRLYCIEQ